MVEFDDEWASATDWARMYRKLGLQVVPAHTPHPGHWKIPALETWLEFQNVLAPDAVFSRWYDPTAGEHRRRLNMGLICGAASGGLVVVDLDRKDGSKAFDWWSGLIAVHANNVEPETWAQRTGGGGRQLLFRSPDGWSPPTFKAPSMCIDVRGQGGFIMCPPSRHSSGQAYEWEPGREPWNGELATAPDWLIEAIDTLREEHGGAPGGAAERTSSDAPKNAFGLDIDDREHKLQVAVWGAVVDLYRESPIPPSTAVQEAEIARLWANYERTTKSRLEAADGQDNAALLEREGRGLSELRRKWSYAMKRWDTKVREAAQEPRPFDPEANTWGGGAAVSGGAGVAPAASITESGPVADIEIIESFAGDPPERPWLVPDWIAEGVVNSLYGGGGSGKSLLAMMLGSSMSVGAPWLGLPTVQGRVLGVFCEDDPDELHRRMWSIRAAMGHVIGYPFGEFKLACRVGHENRLAVLDRTGNVAMGPFFLPLKATVERLNPRLLILDTLADVYGASEIAREQVNWFLKTLLTGLIVSQRERGLTLTVLLLGHPSDSGRMEGGKGYSGSGAWEASVRSRLYLQKPETGGPEERVLTRGKANYASAGQETAMRLIWADGVFKAERELEEEDPGLLRLKLRVADAVRNAWNLKLPYTTAKGHRRNVFVKLVRELRAAGEDGSSVRQAIRDLIDEGRLTTGRNGNVGGLRVAE